MSDEKSDVSGNDPADVRGRAIVLFARSWQALTCIRSLGRKGVEVIAGDELPVTPGGLSKYAIDSFQYPNPNTDPDAFMDCICKVVEEYAPVDDMDYVLIPVQLETNTVARFASRLSDRIAVAAPPFELIEKVNDKGWLAEFAREHDVDVPPTWLPESVAEANALAAELSYPVVVKIRSGIGGSGMQLCHSAEEFTAAYAAIVDEYRPAEGQFPIVQGMAPGEDYCVAAVGKGGESFGLLTYRNVQKLDGSGPGAVRETVAAEAAEANVRKLLHALAWEGVAQVDFVWTGNDDDPAYLIELNARLFGGLFQTVASDIDMPWLVYEHALGHGLPEDLQPNIGVRTETPVLGLLATLKEAADQLSPGDVLSAAWDEIKDSWNRDGPSAALGSGWDRLTQADDIDDRVMQLQTLFSEREENISQAFSSDDPMAILGIVYPLAAYLKYGYLSDELLMGIPRRSQDK